MYYYILSNIFYRTYKFDRITHPWECFTSHNFQWYFNLISLCFVFHIFNSMKGGKFISLSYRAPDILKMPIVVWRHQNELLGPRKGDSERLGRVGFNRGGEVPIPGFWGELRTRANMKGMASWGMRMELRKGKYEILVEHLCRCVASFSP